MTATQISPDMEDQLLLQLGDRLKRLRKAQGLVTVEMAVRVGHALDPIWEYDFTGSASRHTIVPARRDCSN